MLSSPRTRFLRLLTILGLSTVITAPSARADYTATVDPATRYQTFEGWGTSLAWWPNVIGGFPEPYYSDYINKVFDPVQGLGLNVVRYNIGGGENPKYLPPNKPDRGYMGLREAVPGYEPSPGKWDWTVDANQRRVLFDSIKKGVNRFEAFSNSPPYWMTLSGSVTGMPDGGDNLDPKYNAAFADYLTEVVKHFHDDWGLTFRTLEPVNEPSGGWWKQGGHQEGCHFSRPAQTEIVKATGASLAAKSLRGTVVSSPDENTIDDAVRTWNEYDDPAKRTIGQVNTHSYGGSARAALRRIAETNHKRLWMSEYGDGDASGMTLSGRILSDMKIMRPVAWVYWQAVDGGGWGLLVNPEDGAPHYAYTVNEKYYVFAQYTKFVRPGDTLIDIDDSHSLAAYNAKSGKLVIVTTNNTGDPTHVTYDLSRFRKLPPSAKAFQTSGTENLASLPAVTVADKHLIASLPPHSVTTLVLTGVSGVLHSPAASADPFNPNAACQILNQATGQALDGTPTGTDSASLSLRAPSTSPSQLWSFVKADDGGYEIVNQKTGLVLDVSQASHNSGATVIQWSENDGANQQWKIVPATGGAFALLNQNSGLPLDATPTGLTQETAGTTLTQHWKIVKSGQGR